MDAMLLLKRQHQELAGLFDRFEKSNSEDTKLDLFNQIADALAIHTMIEEAWYYPAARSKGTKAELAEAYDEHKEVKRLLMDALKNTSAPGFDGRVAAIRGAVEHHVEEEENSLFPKVRKLLDKADLDRIGDQMNEMTEDLRRKGAARKRLSLTPAKAPA
ncbi:MAG: hemerythrin domain-containing protein [Pseudomonadota bacterium]|nr:hemerythrin domain-containing protein [Pseudomonadota bacterium]